MPAHAELPALKLPRAERVLVFVGAGMSAESGVPTYRGAGGIWGQYRYQDYACQRAFERNPEQVLDFHERRRSAVLACAPHAGHAALARLQALHPDVAVVTQNIDGLLQRGGVRVAAELHGSLWRLRCAQHGIRQDSAMGPFATRSCPGCGTPLRPDITWFEDPVDSAVFARAEALIGACQLFISVGTSAAVWPAAGLIPLARSAGAHLVELNLAPSEAAELFHQVLRGPASTLLPAVTDAILARADT